MKQDGDPLRKLINKELEKEVAGSFPDGLVLSDYENSCDNASRDRLTVLLGAEPEGICGLRAGVAHGEGWVTITCKLDSVLPHPGREG